MRYLLLSVILLAILAAASGAARAQQTLAEAVAAAGARQTTITVSTPQEIAEDLVVPATVTLALTGEGRLTVATGKTLALRGPLLAPVAPVFANALPGQGTVDFEGNTALQEVYPEWWGASPAAAATTNTQAIQAAIYGAYGRNRVNGSEGMKSNRVLKFSGLYPINDELKCYHMNGFRWEGQNKISSGLIQTAENKRIIDGQSVSFGVFSNLSFSTSAKQGEGMALLDINYDGSQGVDLRPQNLTFQDCVFGGNNLGLIGVWLCRAGGGAQGDNIRFYNCYASGFTFAAAVLGGNNTPPLTNSGYAYNAIYVQWIGGDIQACPQYGLASYAGSWIVKWVTMENQCLDGSGFPTQKGADFYFEAPQNPCILEDIRSESLRLVQGTAIIRNCTTVDWAKPWFTENWGQFHLAGTGSFRNALITGTGPGGDGITYRVTNAPEGAVFGGLSKTRATATSAGPPATITVANAGWTPGEFVGYRATILAAAHGRNQYGIIAANTADTLTLKDLGEGVYYKSDYLPSQLYPDFRIVNPSGDVDFVVEPDWGTQFSCTVKGLTTEWEEFPFNTVDGALGSRFNGSIDGLIAYGKIRCGGVNIRNLWVSRADWASDAYGLASSLTSEKWSGIHVRGGNVPWTFPANQGPLTFPSPGVQQMGSDWIVWNRSAYGGGPRYPTLGIGPGDDVFGSGAADPNYQVNKDILAIWGKLGRQTAGGENTPGQPLQLQGGLSTGSGKPGAIEFWFGSGGAPGHQVNGPATRQATLDAGGLTLGPGRGPGTIGAAPAHGQSLQFLAGEELVAVGAAASTRTAMELPAHAVIYAISVRVIADLPGAASFTVVCDGRNCSTAPVAAQVGSTDPGTAGVPFTIGSTPAPIMIVPDVAPTAEGGQVRITAHYYVVTPADS